MYNPSPSIKKYSFNFSGTLNTAHFSQLLGSADALLELGLVLDAFFGFPSNKARVLSVPGRIPVRIDFSALPIDICKKQYSTALRIENL